ncbi:hypothetical protein ES705_33039 [subsurface metagenome]
MNSNSSNFLKISTKFLEGYTNYKGEMCYFSPYITNNIVIRVEKEEDLFQYEVYTSLNQELRYVDVFNQDSYINVEEKIQIWLMLPGIKYNEIIVFSKDQKVWSCIVDSDNNLAFFQLLDQNFNLTNLQYDTKDLFYVDNPQYIFPYFINDNFVALVIFFEKDCVFLLNVKNALKDNSYSFSFENYFISDDLGAIYIILYSKKKGINIIKIFEEFNEKDFPFQIKQFEEFFPPIDIFVHDNCLCIIESNQIIQYPSFNKKLITKHFLYNNKIVNSWQNPLSNKITFLIEKENEIYLRYAEINDNDYQISINEFVYINGIEFKLKKKRVKIHRLANCNFGIIYDGSKLIFWDKKTNSNEILIKYAELKLYDPLECLNFIFNSVLNNDIEEKSREYLRKRKSYTREDDLFILENIYELKTIEGIASVIEHPKNSVYTRFATNYGTPSCDNHFSFEKKCLDCQRILKTWKSEVRKKILEKSYKPRHYAEVGLIRSHSKKERVIRSQTIHLKSKIDSQIYDETVKFLAQVDCRGKSFKKLFLQSLKLIIGKKINQIGLNEINPNAVISLYCEIKPDFKRLKILREEYKKIFGEKPHFFNEKEIYYLKGINAVSKIVDVDINHKIVKSFIIDILKNISMPKIGTIPAALYLLFSKKYSQTLISDSFRITEVTLRSEAKQIISGEINYEKLSKVIMDYKKKLTVQTQSLEPKHNDLKIKEESRDIKKKIEEIEAESNQEFKNIKELVKKDVSKTKEHKFDTNYSNRILTLFSKREDSCYQSICEKRYSQRHNLLKHYLNCPECSNQLINKDINGKFYCKCGKEYKYSYQMANHIKHCKAFKNYIEVIINEEIIPEEEDIKQRNEIDIGQTNKKEFLNLKEGINDFKLIWKYFEDNLPPGTVLFTLKSNNPNEIINFGNIGITIKTKDTLRIILKDRIEHAWINLVNDKVLFQGDHSKSTYRSSFMLALFSQLEFVEEMLQKPISIKFIPSKYNIFKEKY